MTVKGLNKEYLIDSKEWYLEEEQAEVYLSLLRNTYGSSVSAKEDRLLAENLSIFKENLPKECTFIDLGPGDATKSAFLSKNLSIKKYIGVDVQLKFLQIAKQKIEAQGIPLELIKESFENFLKEKNKQAPSFIYLGATYGNFKREDICKRLREFMSSEDWVYLSCARLQKILEK